MPKLDATFVQVLAQSLEDWVLVDFPEKANTTFKHPCGAVVEANLIEPTEREAYIKVHTSWLIDVGNQVADLRNMITQPAKSQFDFKYDNDPQKLARSLKRRVITRYLTDYQTAIVTLKRKQTEQKQITDATQRIISRYPDEKSELTRNSTGKSGFSFPNRTSTEISGSFIIDNSELTGSLQLVNLPIETLEQVLDILLKSSQPIESDRTIVEVTEVHLGLYSVPSRFTSEEAIEAVRTRSCDAQYLDSEYQRDLDTSNWTVSLPQPH